MDIFTKKLRLIYLKMFNENIDKFTEAFIDYNKFYKKKSKNKNKEEFFLNRKIVLRRWLNHGIACTSDFQKSFSAYKISNYHFQAKALFTLDDFRDKSNLKEFENRVEAYLYEQQRAYVNTDYKYIYTFCEESEEIYNYTITEWRKRKDASIDITLEDDRNSYKGMFSFSKNSNMFITINLKSMTLYFLFHDNNDSRSPYIVGTSMGYLAKDNKVPYARKVVFSKEKLDTQDIKLQFILNETESISAIENRLNLNSKALIRDYVIKYSNFFKNYHIFFSRLIRKKFQQNFYYRLAFREFYAFHKLFEKVSIGDTYFIMDYQRTFFEMVKTVEVIQNIPLYVVMDENNKLFFGMSDKSIEIKNRFLNLSHYGVETTLIFVVGNLDNISEELNNFFKELEGKKLTVKLVEKEKIVQSVNSIDFFFIHLGDSRDFVLADPLRDSKDVFKLFRNPTNMEEYRTDYRKILKKSKEVDF